MPAPATLGGAVDGDFKLGSWLVQPSLNNISRNGTTVQLEPKVMGVLVCLAEHPGEPLGSRGCRDERAHEHWWVLLLQGWPAWQSKLVLQCWPVKQAAHMFPPQSTSLSLPSIR